MEKQEILNRLVREYNALYRESKHKKLKADRTQAAERAEGVAFAAYALGLGTEFAALIFNFDK